MQTQQDIPEKLRAAAQAAVAWLNQTQEQSFELTGLVDYDRALNTGVGETYEFGLVLCDGEICTREQVQVEAVADGFEFSLVDAGERDIPPLLDPPEGLRRSWLDGELAKHEFVLLLFYRGLW